MEQRIAPETIEQIALLARLELSQEEKRQVREDGERMLGYMDILNELDTSSMEPMSYVEPAANVFREDVLKNPDGREALLAGAPGGVKNGAVRVPRAVE
jgi:aspartyl-tRNA(Asn)/glutamyl-tRNA(Gln) amidotransferase subunit C